jgi:hypothetical protein
MMRAAGAQRGARSSAALLQVAVRRLLVAGVAVLRPTKRVQWECCYYCCSECRWRPDVGLESCCFVALMCMQQDLCFAISFVKEQQTHPMTLALEHVDVPRWPQC